MRHLSATLMFRWIVRPGEAGYGIADATTAAEWRIIELGRSLTKREGAQIVWLEYSVWKLKMEWFELRPLTKNI